MASEDLTQLPNTRKEAVASGAMYFFSGHPCPKGHVDKRRTVNSTCFTCTSMRAKDWIKKNPERMSELVKKSKKKFRERDRNALQKWRVQNRESVRVHNAHYLIRKKNAEGAYNKADIRNILISQNNKCNGCGVDISNNYHVDHIMPLLLGGSNWPENLQCLCPSCNSSKKAIHPEKWKKRISANAELVDA